MKRATELCKVLLQLILVYCSTHKHFGQLSEHFFINMYYINLRDTITTYKLIHKNESNAMNKIIFRPNVIHFPKTSNIKNYLLIDCVIINWLYYTDGMTNIEQQSLM